MSNLENLTSKILAEAKERAMEITNAAHAEAESGIAREVAAAHAEADKLVADAKTEAELTAERIIQGKTLAVRDENLGAKRQMLDKVFAEALKRLNGMPEPEYFAYLRGYLAKLDLKGQTVIVPAKYAKAAKELGEALPAARIGSGAEQSDAAKAAPALLAGVTLANVTDAIKHLVTGPDEKTFDLLFSDTVDGGFVMVREGIEQNHTFSALLEYYRYELESEVLRILYA